MKQASLFITIVIGLSFASGCAANRGRIIIDPAGVDMGQYQNDLVQCQQLAMQVKRRAGGGAVGGAIVGGAVGAVIGDKKTTRKAAGVGAIGGTLRGARATRFERYRVVKNCLRNRGYQVLN